MERLAYNYREVLKGHKRLEAARNDVRKLIYEFDHNLFSYGQIGTNVIELARKLMVGDQSPCYAKLQCTSCNKLDSIDPSENFMHIMQSRLKISMHGFKIGKNILQINASNAILNSTLFKIMQLHLRS